MPQDRAQRPGSPPLPISASGGSLSDSEPGTPTPGAARPQGTYFLGRYRVVDEIGIGGMASVHLARMDGPGGFQKWVAIKRIHPHLVEDESFIQMFLDEARVAARISHPNVASVFELGKHEDTYWIAMEYLHGEPLREVMRRTEELGAPMPPEIACRVIADAAEGLNAAHELVGKNGEKLNLIHRDVTPHNLFVTYDGTTKVVDFGIAKFTSRMSSTRAGTLKGKLAYMSPEQVQGEPIDRRTDIFALGVVLWELTTGQRLFRMESDLDTLAKVQECNIPRPSSIVRGYPIDLEKIVMKALAKNRGERFKTAREFSRALQSLLMRRGLFIASDEVATYVTSIFQERIAKREAHLRWASDVTQTINVDGMLGTPPVGLGSPLGEASIRSYSSEVQAASPNTLRGPPRPAAGAPPSVHLAGNPPVVPGSQRPPPRPAPRLDRSPPPPPSSPHPADDEQPTLQATAEQRAAMGIPQFVEDELDDHDDNDDTIVTLTPALEPARGPLPSAAPLPAAGRPAAPPQSVHGNRTLPLGAVSVAAPSTLPFPPTAGPPLPFGGRPQGQGSGPYPQAQYPQAQRSGGYPQAPGPLQAPGHPQAPGVNPFAPTVPPPSISDPSLPNTRAGSRESFNPYPAPPPQQPFLPAQQPFLPQPPNQGVPQNQPDGMPRYPPPRLFAPVPQGQGTVTALAMNRRPPMWLVAVGSGLAALVVAAVVFIVLTQLVFTTPPRRTAVKAGPSAGSPVPVSPAVSPAATAMPIPPSGPFQAARLGFLSALAKDGPTSMTAPPSPGPTVAATATAVAAVPVSAPGPSGDTPKPATAIAVAVADGRAPAAAAPSQPSYAQPAAQPQPQTWSTPGTSGDTPRPRRSEPRAQPSEPQAQGLISVICLPACEQVSDNGKSIGGSPIFKRPIGVGSHKLKLQSGGFVKVVSASVLVDQLTVVRESMTP